MDATEKGAYIMLLISHYQVGETGLPDDDKQLARIAGVSGKTWSRIRPVMAAKFNIENKLWVNQKAVDTLRKVAQLRSQNSAKALKRYNSGDATAELQQCQPKPKPNIDISNDISIPQTPKGDFPEWYGIYPHKVGRAAAEKAYAKAIKLTNREDLISGLRKYIETKPPDRPWCNPATWLNQQRWMDEPNETANTPNRISNQPSKTERAKQALLKSAIDLGYADTGPERQGGAYEHSLSVLSEP